MFKYLSKTRSAVFVLLFLSGFRNLSFGANRAEILVDPQTVLNSRIYGFGHALVSDDGPFSVPVDEKEAKIFIDILNNYGPGSFWRVRTSQMYFEPFNDDSDSSIANLKDGFIFTEGFQDRKEIEAMKKQMIWNMSDWDWFQRSWDGLIRMLDYCESKNITVTINNACIGPKWGNPNHPQLSQFHRRWDKYCWLGETEHGERNGKRPNYSDDWGDAFFLRTSANDYPYDLEEFGEAMGALIYYLKVVKNYKCIEFFSFYNEPDSTMTSPSVNYPDSHQELYAVVDRHLKKFTFTLTGDKKDQQTINLRDKVKIIMDGYMQKYSESTYADDNGKRHRFFSSSISSPEELLPWILTNTNKIGEKHTGDHYIDALGDHGWDLLRLDFDATAAFTELHGMVNNIQTYCAKILPRYFGVIKEHASRPKELLYMEGGAYVEQKENWKPFEFIQVESALRMVAAGVKGHVRWRVDNDFIMKKDKSFVPHRYYPYALLTHFVKKGSDVLKTEIKGALKDDTEVWPVITEVQSAQRVWPVCFRSPEGKMTLIVVNDSANPAELTIRIPSDKQLALSVRYVYDADPKDSKVTTGLDKISAGILAQDVKNSGEYSLRFENGKTTLFSLIPGCSIVAYSEFQ